MDQEAEEKVENDGKQIQVDGHGKSRNEFLHNANIMSLGKCK